VYNNCVCCSFNKKPPVKQDPGKMLEVSSLHRALFKTGMNHSAKPVTFTVNIWFTVNTWPDNIPVSLSSDVKHVPRDVCHLLSTFKACLRRSAVILSTVTVNMKLNTYMATVAPCWVTVSGWTWNYADWLTFSSLEHY